jgi:hypothetical protein
MKPRIQRVLTQWIRGFMTSGSRPIVRQPAPIVWQQADRHDQHNFGRVRQSPSAAQVPPERFDTQASSRQNIVNP